MIKISRLADYAVVVLAELAKQGEGLSTTITLAEGTALPEPTTAKVLKLLSRADIVTSVRGAGGGYRLDRDLSSVSVKDVLHAIDGPVFLTACVEGCEEKCDYRDSCSMKGCWSEVNEAVRDALAGITLDQIVPTKEGV